jgi:hypothetical protein
MFPLYYNVVVDLVASAATIPVNEIDTTSIPSTDDTSIDTLHLVELKPQI